MYFSIGRKTTQKRPISRTLRTAQGDSLGKGGKIMVNLFWLLVSIIALLLGLTAAREWTTLPLTWLTVLLSLVLLYGLLIRPVRGIIENRRKGCDWLEALGPHAWELGIFLSLLSPFLQTPLGINKENGIIMSLLGLTGLAVGFLISAWASIQVKNQAIFDRQMRRFAEGFRRYSPRPPHQYPSESRGNGPRWTFEQGTEDQWKKR
jgi:hypothetical protein